MNTVTDSRMPNLHTGLVTENRSPVFMPAVTIRRMPIPDTGLATEHRLSLSLPVLLFVPRYSSIGLKQ